MNTSATPTPYPLPSVPNFKPPPGACNAHAHAMGPFDRFPAPPGHGSPPLAPIENFVAGMDRLGLQYGVFVQSSGYGTDCRILIDALERYPARLRGVALATTATPDAELQAMHKLGVRGLRFTGLPFPGKRGKSAGSITLEELPAMAPKLRELGWHAQLWLHCDQLLELAPQFLKLKIPLVLDHMARFEPSRGVKDPAFQNILRLLKEEDVWVKLNPTRNSDQFPDYADARPFHDALVAANADRLVWGSDWPHTNMGDRRPDGGRLLDQFAEWVSDKSIQTKILAANAARLYGF